MKACFNELTARKNGSLPADITLCGKAGFDAIELSKGNVIRYLRSGGSAEQLRDMLQEHHVQPASLNAVENITFQNKASQRMLRELTDWSCAASRAIGCDCMEVIASFGISDRSEAEIRKETICSLLSLSDIAARYDVKLALEFMAIPDSSVRSFDQCLDIIEAVDRSNVGMLLDTWHFFACGAEVDEVFQLPPSRLFMLHVSDCPARAPYETPRAESYWPGDGDAPLASILSNLQKVGYRGVCSIEAMSPAIHALPLEEGIHMAKEKLETLMASAGVQE